MVIRKSYLERIEPYMNKPLIKVITGMRRCGKSTLLSQMSRHLVQKGVKEKNILVINMESLTFASITNHTELHRYVMDYFAKIKGPRYLFIDEVQEIPLWEKAIGSFLADAVADTTISGSNAHMLSSELATLLTGRYVAFQVYPLTFSEFLTFRGKSNAKDRSVRESEFAAYMRHGGLPGIHHFDGNEEVIREYLSSVMNSILLRDVVMRNAVRDPSLLERVCRFVFDNCGNITTAKGISDYARSQKMKLSVDTVISYIGYLSEAYLVSRVSRYDIKGKKHLEIYEKYYMGDIGLRNGFIGYRDNDIAAILENILFNEMQMRGFTASIGKIGDYEIDFIAAKDDRKIYIQVAYLLASRETIEREYRSLEEVPDSFPKYVVSLDTTLLGIRNGIKHYNFIDFILMEKW
jgi:uncharacterized protein